MVVHSFVPTRPRTGNESRKIGNQKRRRWRWSDLLWAFVLRDGGGGKGKGKRARGLAMAMMSIVAWLLGPFGLKGGLWHTLRTLSSE